jgi:ankyrin repeat protein
MELLIEQGASIHARTGDRLKNTALHLAARGTTPAAVVYLCRLVEDDPEESDTFLNATNAEGETALHIAVRRENIGALTELLQAPKVDIHIKNKQGQKAVQCVPQSKFGFDRESAESTILTMFSEVEA